MLYKSFHTDLYRTQRHIKRMKSIDNVSQQHIELLVQKGFKPLSPKSPYEKTRLELPHPKITAIYYTSKKLLLQTSKENEQDALSILTSIGLTVEQPFEHKSNKTTSQRSSRYKGNCVGSDETLKGDTFGGLVVAAVHCDEVTRNKLRELGVKDSKELEDAQIKTLASKIKEIIGPTNYSVKNMYPKEYNTVTNTTELLNILHREAFLDIKRNHQDLLLTHIVDKYPGCKVGDIIETKADSTYVEVAAASILARDEGLNQFKELTQKAGFIVPKGSTHVAQALKQLKQSGKDPHLFVKMHFKNVQQTLNT